MCSCCCFSGLSKWKFAYGNSNNCCHNNTCNDDDVDDRRPTPTKLLVSLALDRFFIFIFSLFFSAFFTTSPAATLIFCFWQRYLRNRCKYLISVPWPSFVGNKWISLQVQVEAATGSKKNPNKLDKHVNDYWHKKVAWINSGMCNV